MVLSDRFGDYHSDSSTTTLQMRNDLLSVEISLFALVNRTPTPAFFPPFLSDGQLYQEQRQVSHHASILIGR